MYIFQYLMKILFINVLSEFLFNFFRAVDSEILNILRMRYEDCMLYENPDHLTVCKPFWEKYKAAEEAWFIKCELNFLFTYFTIVLSI